MTNPSHREQEEEEGPPTIGGINQVFGIANLDLSIHTCYFKPTKTLMCNHKRE